MSMSLNRDDLISIADALHHLNNTDVAITVERFKCAGHVIVVERTEQAGQDAKYVVRGITDQPIRDK